MSDDFKIPKVLSPVYGKCTEPVATARNREYGRYCEHYNRERRKRIKKCWDCTQLGYCDPSNCQKEKRGKDDG